MSLWTLWTKSTRVSSCSPPFTRKAKIEFSNRQILINPTTDWYSAVLSLFKNMTEMRLVYTDTEALFVSFKTYWLSKRYVPSLTHISLNTVFPGAFLLLFLHHMATCMSTPARVFFHSFIPVIFLSQNSNSLWWRKCRMQLRGWQGCFPRSCLLKEISVHFLHTFLAGNVPVNHGCLCWLESIWNHIPIGFTMSNAKIFYILLKIY